MNDEDLAEHIAFLTIAIPQYEKMQRLSIEAYLHVKDTGEYPGVVAYHEEIGERIVQCREALRKALEERDGAHVRF